MQLLHPLAEELVELVARRFRVLGEPSRIRLLDGERSVNELAAHLGAGQRNIEQQLHAFALVVAGSTAFPPRPAAAAGRRPH